MIYDRNMRGHGQHAPDAGWPGGATFTVQFVLDQEEGGENCTLHGDAGSEAFLSDIPSATQWPGLGQWNMESIYECVRASGRYLLEKDVKRQMPLDS